ncbi:MAG: hypothetical protein WC070_00150 [Candidatus Magasanikbacteria bacterium]
MFGKKKNTVKKEEPNLNVTVIPEVFYGGQDPYIYKVDNEQISNNNVSKKTEKIDHKLKVAQQKNNQKDKKLFWIVSIVSFIIVVSGITWYYLAPYYKARKISLENTNNSQNNNTEIINIDVLPIKTVTTTEDIVSTTSTLEELVSSTPSLQNVFLQFPAILTLDTADIDADSLTDLEEEVFGTDSGTWDSDKDNYYDGQEVYNLYNPKGLAPVKIIDSGLVNEYKNNYSGYRLYYPNTWQKGAVDAVETQVLFSSANGDYIEVRVFKKDVGQQFISWFSRYAEGQNYSDLQSFKNRFSESSWLRKDSLVSYFEDSNYIFVMVYHPKDRGPVAYRHVMQMMYQSFRMPKTDTVLPEQIIYPSTTSSTTNVSNTVNFVTNTSF